MVQITTAQRDVHVRWETAALVVVMPFMGYVATRKELPSWARLLAAGIGVSTLIIDGGLLAEWRKNRG